MSKNEKRKVREMKEKDLFLSIIGDGDISAIFELIGEKTKSKNFAFKKQKLKQIINSTTGSIGPNKKPVWEWLTDEFSLQYYGELTINQVLTQFVLNEPYIPLSFRFFTLRKYFPEFFEEKFPQMVENVENGNYFLANLISYKTEDEFVAFWEQQASFVAKTGSMRYFIDTIYDWVESCLPEEVQEALPCIQEFSFDSVAQVFNQEDNLGFSATIFLLTYLKHHDLDEQLKMKIFFALQFNIFQLLRSFANRFVEEAHDAIQTEKQEFQQKQKEFKKELRQLEQQLKQKESEFKRQESKSQKEVQTVNEEMRRLRVKYEKENHQLTTEVNVLNETVLKQKQLVSFFQRGLTQRYNEAKWVICHNLPLMFAPEIFPEFEFVRINDIEKVNFKNINCLWIQQSGLSYAEKRQLTTLAQKHRVSVHEFGAKEERELIMELSVMLKHPHR